MTTPNLTLYPWLRNTAESRYEPGHPSYQPFVMPNRNQLYRYARDERGFTGPKNLAAPFLMGMANDQGDFGKMGDYVV